MNQIMSWFTDKLAPGMQKIFSRDFLHRKQERLRRSQK